MTATAADGINLWMAVDDQQIAMVALAAHGIAVAPGAPFWSPRSAPTTSGSPSAWSATASTTLADVLAVGRRPGQPRQRHPSPPAPARLALTLVPRRTPHDRRPAGPAPGRAARLDADLLRRRRARDRRPAPAAGSPTPTGRTYLDFFGGVLTNMIGYDIAEISEAVQRQLATGVVHTSTLYLIRQQVELAEKIARLSGIPDARVFFTNSGTEANEAALLFATNLRRSNQILADQEQLPRPHVRHHGDHRAPQLVVQLAQPAAASPGWPPATGCAAGWPGCPTATSSTRPSTTCARCWPRSPPGDVAALIAEPIQGVGGFVHAPGRPARRATRRCSTSTASC